MSAFASPVAVLGQSTPGRSAFPRRWWADDVDRFGQPLSCLTRLGQVLDEVGTEAAQAGQAVVARSCALGVGPGGAVAGAVAVLLRNPRRR